MLAHTPLWLPATWSALSKPPGPVDVYIADSRDGLLSLGPVTL